jgi:erythromycin esterase
VLVTELKPTRRARQHLLTILMSLPLGTLAAQASLNLGFEAHGADGRVLNWGGGGDGYQMAVDSIEPFAGRFSLRSQWIGGDRLPQQRAFGSVTTMYPVQQVMGRRLHLTGYIRTHGVSGYAGFWMRVDGPNGMIALDNMSERGPRATTPWTRYDIELLVDSGAVRVVVGLLHSGTGTAWFDSLSLDVVGPPMPRTVAPIRFEPRPPNDVSRLLSDAELALPPDSVLTIEDPDVTAWVKGNAKPIRSLGATDFSDLRLLAPLLRDKRIVQLGESGHGVAEFSMAKVRLIKYLHEELGYDVMAFESGLFECDRAQRAIATLSATDLMRNCIFGVWQAREVVPLFQYIKETQNTTRPLVLAGFDEQMSSQVMSRTRPDFFRRLIAPIDTTYAQHVYLADSTFIANSNLEYARENRERLVPFYDSLTTFFRTNRRAIETANRDDKNIAIVARQAALSMSIFVPQLALSAVGGGIELRDKAMADNLDVLLDELHPGKKVIVWAHNFHIQHRENSPNTPRTMGTFVSRRHRKELYTIGLFMYRGGAAQNDRRPYAIRRGAPGSLESILHRAPWQQSFVDLSKAKREQGSEWMWKPISGLSWGLNPELFVPRDEYDGILFVDTVHVPVYLQY